VKEELSFPQEGEKGWDFDEKWQFLLKKAGILVVFGLSFARNSFRLSENLRFPQVGGRGVRFLTKNLKVKMLCAIFVSFRAKGA
jgi:hypothetical protein